jgi:imidazolonepropionase-like amidohydrolase
MDQGHANDVLCLMPKSPARLLLVALLLSAFALKGEEGHFRLHKFKQLIGQETYSVEKVLEGRKISSDFMFRDRGTRVALKGSMVLRADGTVFRLDLKGSTCRGNSLNLEIDGSEAPVRVLRNGERQLCENCGGIGIGSYAPIAFQQELVRLWIRKGRPGRMDTLPSGQIRIWKSGEDNLHIDGKAYRLSRILISDLSWGQESLWIDRKGRLIALVGTDTEFDHFEAVRDGFEEALPHFIRMGAMDQLRNLSRDDQDPSLAGTAMFAVSGALLIDGTGREPIPDSVVLVKGGRILSVGTKDQVKIPLGCKVLPGAGKTIIPGLWDMHAHFEQVEWGPVYLAAGVTTVRDMGNETEFILALRKGMDSGAGIGPRLFLSGLIDGRSDQTLGVEVANSPGEARALVRRYKALGFDQIKIYSSLKKEVLQAAVQEAHRLGLRVAGHLPNGIVLQDALALGMDEMTHISSIERDFYPKGANLRVATPELDLTSPASLAALAAMKSSGAVFDPTMAIFELFTASPANPLALFEPGVAKLPASLAGNYQNSDMTPGEELNAQTLWAQRIAILKAVHQAGVPVVAGTDQGVPGHSLHRELELYVQAGFTPMEAIQAATLVPAKVMGQLSNSGTVEAGKRADFLVLNANPMEDIHNVRKIQKVFLAGQGFDPALLWRMVGFQP